MDGDRGRPMSRRAKVFSILGIALVLIISFTVLAVGGAQDTPAGHGPGHQMGTEDGSQHGGGNHTRPAGGHHGAAEPTSNGSRGPVTWTVEVNDNAFHADNVTIQVGDTVKWIHVGSNPHTVTAKDASFDSHPDCNTLVDGPLGRCMSKDATYSRTFDKVGSVAYQCKLHKDQNMVATVQVLQSYNRTPDPNHH